MELKQRVRPLGIILESETGKPDVQSLIVGELTIAEKQTFDNTLMTGLGAGKNKEDIKETSSPLDLTVQKPEHELQIPIDLSGKTVNMPGSSKPEETKLDVPASKEQASDNKVALDLSQTGSTKLVDDTGNIIP